MAADDELLKNIRDLIRSEFIEVPGLSLTRDQIRRLWALDAAIADVVIAGLLRSGFLRLGAHGQYLRADLARP